MYIDIHVHNQYEQENSRLVLNIFPNSIDKLECNGLYSVGLHPWYINEKTYPSEINSVKTASENHNVIAIGEIGLDKNIDVSYLTQVKVFEQQLEIAENSKKPVIIHCVKAYDDIISIRKKSNRSIPWIIHWFNASEQIAGELLKYNCYLSFGIMLFKENSKAFKVFQNMPLNKAFFETDDTGISISEVYEKAVIARNIKLTELNKQIKSNFKSCFGHLI